MTAAHTFKLGRPGRGCQCEDCRRAQLRDAAPDLAQALIGVLRVADRATQEFDAARAALAKAGL